MDSYILICIFLGLVGLSVFWIPALAKKINISYSIIYLVLGMGLFALFGDEVWPAPLHEADYTLRLSELAVIIALMGTGLKIDRPFSLKKWKIPVRFMLVTMLIGIIGMAMLGVTALGFTLVSAILLGAVMAPTDPVLAGEVQVGPPGDGKEDVVRFTLTAEAGMNDGLAFPFVWLAIVVTGVMGAYASAQVDAAGTVAEALRSSWFWEWLARDLIYRIIAGIAIGFAGGRFVAFLFLYLPEKIDLPGLGGGMVALSTTLLVYGLTEMAHGYGFIAVFTAAVTLRNYEMRNEYHERLHSFAEQVEHLLLAVILIFLGGSVGQGILQELTWPMIAVALGFIFVLRPLSGVVALAGLPMRLRERLSISFFGIRGVGSIFYLAFALHETEFVNADELWAMTAFIIMASVFLHGLSAPWAMKYNRQ